MATETVAFLARRTGLACLDALASSEFRPRLLLTHRFERGTRTPRPELAAFEERAAQLELPLSTPAPERLAEVLESTAYDFLVSVNASHTFPARALARARRAAVNLHPSPVEAGRMLCPGGDTRACLQRGLERGLAGVTLHHMTPEVDAGEIIAWENVETAPARDADAVFERILPLYPRLLLAGLRGLA